MVQLRFRSSFSLARLGRKASAKISHRNTQSPIQIRLLKNWLLCPRNCYRYHHRHPKIRRTCRQLVALPLTSVGLPPVSDSLFPPPSVREPVWLRLSLWRWNPSMALGARRLHKPRGVARLWELMLMPYRHPGTPRILRISCGWVPYSTGYTGRNRDSTWNIRSFEGLRYARNARNAPMYSHAYRSMTAPSILLLSTVPLKHL